MPLLRTLAASGALLALTAAQGCTCVLPERFAVNAPMLHQLLGLDGPGAPSELTVDERMRSSSSARSTATTSDYCLISWTS